MGEKTLTIRAGRLDEAARAEYAKAMLYDTTGGLAQLDDLVDGADLFEVLDGERVVLRYALRLDERPRGREGVIVAAVGSLPGYRLAEVFTPVIERQFAGADAVRCDTVRKGLARELLKQGYSLHFRLRKALK